MNKSGVLKFKVHKFYRITLSLFTKEKNEKFVLRFMDHFIMVCLPVWKRKGGTHIPSNPGAGR